MKHYCCAEMNLERMQKGDLSCSYPLANSRRANQHSCVFLKFSKLARCGNFTCS